MSDRGGCIVCGVVMGGEADPLRCHDCVENKYMEQTGTLATFIRMTDSGPVAIEAAPPPLDGLICALCMFVGDSEDPRPITILNGTLTCEPHNNYFQGGNHVQAIITWKREHPAARETA